MNFSPRIERVKAVGEGESAEARAAARARLLARVIAKGWEQLLEEVDVSPDDLITGGEARERLKLSKSAFRKWCERSRIPSYRLGVARAVRYRWSAIEKAVEECRRASTTLVAGPPSA